MFKSKCTLLLTAFCLLAAYQGFAAERVYRCSDLLSESKLSIDYEWTVTGAEQAPLKQLTEIGSTHKVSFNKYGARQNPHIVMSVRRRADLPPEILSRVNQLLLLAQDNNSEVLLAILKYSDNTIRDFWVLGNERSVGLEEEFFNNLERAKAERGSSLESFYFIHNHPLHVFEDCGWKCPVFSFEDMLTFQVVDELSISSSEDTQRHYIVIPDGHLDEHDFNDVYFQVDAKSEFY